MSFKVLRPTNWYIYRKQKCCVCSKRFDYWSHGMPMEWKIFESFPKAENEERKNGKNFRWMSLVELMILQRAKIALFKWNSVQSIIFFFASFGLAFAITFNFLFANKSIVQPQFACEMQSTITLSSQLDIEVHLQKSPITILQRPHWKWLPFNCIIIIIPKENGRKLKNESRRSVVYKWTKSITGNQLWTF